MDNIGKTLKRVVLLVAGGGLLLFVLIAINQTIQIVDIASGVHPVFGTITLVFLLLAFGAVVFIPIAMLMKFSQAPELPRDASSPEYRTYVENLRLRLSKNKVLKEEGFVFDAGADTVQEVERALAVLHLKSSAVIKANASAVFLTTAISQNGFLDGAFVLVSITRMVWQVAKIYQQRPSPRQLAALYGNIAATVLMARGIEDVDLLDEQIEPVIASVLGGGLASLVPGAVTVTTLIVSAITEGAVNALLTLRVGSLSQRYCGATVRQDPHKIRRAATVEACSLLGAMIRENAVIVLKAFGKATRRAAAKLVKRPDGTKIKAARLRPSVLAWLRIKRRPSGMEDLTEEPAE